MRVLIQSREQLNPSSAQSDTIVPQDRFLLLEQLASLVKSEPTSLKLVRPVEDVSLATQEVTVEQLDLMLSQEIATRVTSALEERDKPTPLLHLKEVATAPLETIALQGPQWRFLARQANIVVQINFPQSLEIAPPDITARVVPSRPTLSQLLKAVVDALLASTARQALMPQFLVYRVLTGLTPSEQAPLVVMLALSSPIVPTTVPQTIKPVMTAITAILMRFRLVPLMLLAPVTRSAP